ncbi:hypothetical protein RHMOL_Rhmol06G0217000 [Rhododendron molle]|uniref:Uncharacterized protein n=1 Tax=Rhododendron molle TaxID=49168 RepID=A0ACC0NH68_RHOML|nr:hypothetical protein RHMOL_Rhmol06G0217000 [Rhododendron molle]
MLRPPTSTKSAVVCVTMENPSPATAVTTDYHASGDKGDNHYHRFDRHNPTSSKSTRKIKTPTVNSLSQ